ncbi:hypothetical protein ETD86_29590 [Nonomuraea turkmeniaca]|uniref:Uncharacterized protein n=1 Tax=Nonomuraea turkmeniaca TaxID=103838 RepID=A0A5S4FBA4_9ACTN|nr:hypothetical protein [Nonomuraea turkmeniaca]TMR14101.1 hypothetical protein ETD86_29590 [Nonomuraea turkmeniaca]
MTHNAKFKKRVRAFADQHNLTYQQALQHFNPDGTVRLSRPAECMGDHDKLVCPCEGCEPDRYRSWLTERAPRLARAREAGDPIYDFDHDELNEYFEAMAQYRQLKAALSPLAETRLKEEWALARDGEWPSGWEFTLIIRDAWEQLILPLERDCLRADLAEMVNHIEYPLSGRNDSGYEMDGDGPASREDLADEITRLEELAAQAATIARLIRDHLQGGSAAATDVVT